MPCEGGNIAAADQLALNPKILPKHNVLPRVLPVILLWLRQKCGSVDK
jgi:hypothetical protein